MQFDSKKLAKILMNTDFEPMDDNDKSMFLGVEDRDAMIGFYDDEIVIIIADGNIHVIGTSPNGDSYEIAYKPIVIQER